MVGKRGNKKITARADRVAAQLRATVIPRYPFRAMAMEIAASRSIEPRDILRELGDAGIVNKKYGPANRLNDLMGPRLTQEVVDAVCRAFAEWDDRPRHPSNKLEAIGNEAIGVLREKGAEQLQLAPAQVPDGGDAGKGRGR